MGQSEQRLVSSIKKVIRVGKKLKDYLIAATIRFLFCKVVRELLLSKICPLWSVITMTIPITTVPLSAKRKRDW